MFCSVHRWLLSRHIRFTKLIFVISFPLGLGVLGGCVSFSGDAKFSNVQALASSHTKAALTWAKTDDDQDVINNQVAKLLSQPLSADDAVQIALLNNKGLQATYFELGISEAQLVQASTLPNPSLSMLHTSRNNGGVSNYKIEQFLTFNIFALITMPQSVEIEQRRFEQTQTQVTMAVLDLAVQTRKAYFKALAAQENVRLMEQANTASEAANELGARLGKVGNWTRLQELGLRNAQQNTSLTLARAQQSNQIAREQFIRLLGLSGKQLAFRLPEHLPKLPKQLASLPATEQAGIDGRLDLQAIRLQTEALAKNLGLTKATRFINVLEFGPGRTLEGPLSDPYQYGYSISFELPIFDWGTAKIARAEAIYLQALNVAAQAAINAQSEIRESYKTHSANYEVANRYQSEVLPLRKQIALENQLRYNAMLISVFDLLSDAQLQIYAVNSAIEATRDFWIAQVNLEMDMNSKPQAERLPLSPTNNVGELQ